MLVDIIHSKNTASNINTKPFLKLFMIYLYDIYDHGIHVESYCFIS